MKNDMLKIKNLYKQYSTRSEQLTVVDNVNLSVAAGAFVTLLGPSGCGKTTTLRMIAGLETPSSGVIEIDGQPIYCSKTKKNVPVNQRPSAMVFQSYAIWPHMNVFQNVAFPLRSRKFRLTKAEIRDRTEEALLAVGLSNHANRDPSALSGGQQQRVALARALVSRPKILLLDEPLSNLDVRLREQMRDKIREVHAATKLTTIFVTHDQNEAMALSSEIVVMNAGKIVESGSPQKVFENPISRFAANFVGKHNIFEGKVQNLSVDGYALVSTETGIIRAKLRENFHNISTGDSVLLYVRPQSIALAQPDEQTLGVAALVKSTIYQGGYWELKTELANGDIVLVHVDLAKARCTDLINLSSVYLIPDEDEVVVATSEHPNAE
jgi:iron(III) transport system ATP-binding protein